MIVPGAVIVSNFAMVISAEKSCCGRLILAIKAKNGLSVKIFCAQAQFFFLF